MMTKEEKRMYQVIEKTIKPENEQIVTIENYTCPICKSVNTFWRNDEPGWWECENCNSTFR